ncbi:MAG: protein kinase [Myxococcota bacterium]
MTVEDEPQLLEPGTAVDRWEIEGVLGAGGMATVYLARHRRLGTLHALKLLSVDRPGVRRRAEREARVQATIRHPNLVAVTDVIEHEGKPGLVLEYVRGPALDQFIAACAPTFPQIDLLARGLLRGVAHAHRCGAIHRDLKPANVLIAVTDHALEPKVADFGLVKLVDADPGAQTRMGTVMGTPSYMSPEQFDDASSVDARTDVWSLGALLYELCTRNRAFNGLTTSEIFAKVTRGEYTPVRSLVPNLPQRMERAIEGALQTDRATRFPSVDAVLEVWCGDVPDEQIAAVFHRPPPIWDAPTLSMARALCVSASGAPPVPLENRSAVTWADELPLRVPRRARWWLAVGLVSAPTAALVALLAVGGFALLRPPAPAVAVSPAEPAPPRQTAIEPPPSVEPVAVPTEDPTPAPRAEPRAEPTAG